MGYSLSLTSAIMGWKIKPYPNDHFIPVLYKFNSVKAHLHSTILCAPRKMGKDLMVLNWGWFSNPLSSFLMKQALVLSIHSYLTLPCEISCLSLCLFYVWLISLCFVAVFNFFITMRILHRTITTCSWNLFWEYWAASRGEYIECKLATYHNLLYW